jgi:hypothetical protein
MNTLYVNYTKTGDPISDHQVESNILAQADLCINGQDKQWNVSTENVINAVRAFKVSGKITCDLVVMFEGQTLSMGEYGKIDNWPMGFCDYNEKWICEIFKAQVKAYKDSVKIKAHENQK